ncbi:MAG: hypothetical protein GY768_06875 [Planctomycetaceae bacterium]|nr:hypothetical protein [Planctomycetaceae bacterium]
MPIEFDCPACGKRLRVPDGSAGRQAVCPDCSAQVEIPGSTPAPAQPSLGEQANQSFNPYTAPSTDFEKPVADVSSELTPTLTSMSEILKTSWNIYKNNFGKLALIGIILIAISIGSSVVSSVLGLLPLALMGQVSEIAATIISALLQFTWGQAFGAFVVAVGIRYTLGIIAGNVNPLEDAFKIFDCFWRVLFAQVLVYLFMIFSALACALVAAPFLFFNNADVGDLAVSISVVIGVVYVATCVCCFLIYTRLLITLPLIVDRNNRILEAITNSISYTKGNTLAIAGSFLVVGILGTLFAIITCLIGTVLVIPFYILMTVVIYRLTTGQPCPTSSSPFVALKEN